MFAKLRSTGNAALNLLYPPHCIECNADTVSGIHLCKTCHAAAVRIKTPFCHVCSEPFEGQIDSAFACPNCRDRKFNFDSAIVGYRSTGVVREIVHKFKYNHRLYLRHVLGDWLADNLSDSRLETPFDRIIPVPLHSTRQRERGFNQAHILASFLAGKTGVPLCTGLKRIRATPTQTRFEREARIENLRNAFSISHTTEVRNLHVLLVDDVFTTGSTADECARVLKSAGAATVRVVTVARG